MADERPLEEQILFSIENDVAWITINRPERGNAITPECRDRIRSLISGLNGRFDARAVVLTAAGEKMFCPGADISTDRVYPPRPEGAPDLIVGEPRRMMLEGQLKLVPAIMDCELPVIAAVNGTAAGGGSHLALACDMIVMSTGAKFIEVFVRRGIMPDAGGCYLLPRLVGIHRAKELMFLGEECVATEAERIGLVNRVVAPDQVQAEAEAIAQRLCNLPTRAIALTKSLTNRSLESSREQSFAQEALYQDLVAATADMAEGIAAFTERRDPQFRGW